MVSPCSVKIRLLLPSDRMRAVVAKPPLRLNALALSIPTGLKPGNY